ncbi:MAG: DNA-processing protein DprA [Proteobacteria bacterium]|nr:DNA-processing protein DprA [Pseudomonadota bacterium]MDA0928167.1 DNA-processing protein DprA [Pseudomonadota bacterium]
MEEQHLQAYLRLLFYAGISEAWLGPILYRHGSLLQAAKEASEYLLTEQSAGNLDKLATLASAYDNDQYTNHPKIDLINRWRQIPGNHLLCFDSSDYPLLLKEIPCPPPLLFVRGKPELLGSACCGMVGSRKASAYGMRNAKWIAQDLAASGFTIVSGLAAGIDSCAHRGALLASGSTIAILGCGIDRAYPKQNRALMEEIAQIGTIVSEYPLGTEPSPHLFPRRNRIISGLSLGIIVVEAATRSGSLITARLAMEQGREVFAVPGPIGSRHTSGCHKLIRDGATLIEDAKGVTTALLDGWRLNDDSLSEELCKSHSANPSRCPAIKPFSAGSPGERVLAAISEPECLMDSVAQRVNLSLSEVSSIMLELEIAGLVAIEGGRVTRC